MNPWYSYFVIFIVKIRSFNFFIDPVFPVSVKARLLEPAVTLLRDVTGWLAFDSFAFILLDLSAGWLLGFIEKLLFVWVAGGFCGIY